MNRPLVVSRRDLERRAATRRVRPLFRGFVLSWLTRDTETCRTEAGDAPAGQGANRLR
jgi:hypothetical protein